jgi:hypothetical protein
MATRPRPRVRTPRACGPPVPTSPHRPPPVLRRRPSPPPGSSARRNALRMPLCPRPRTHCPLPQHRPARSVSLVALVPRPPCPELPHTPCSLGRASLSPPPPAAVGFTLPSPICRRPRPAPPSERSRARSVLARERSTSSLIDASTACVTVLKGRPTTLGKADEGTLSASRAHIYGCRRQVRVAHGDCACAKLDTSKIRRRVGPPALLQCSDLGFWALSPPPPPDCRMAGKAARH